MLSGGEASGRGVGVCSACQHMPFNNLLFTLEFSASDKDTFRNVHIWHTKTGMATLRLLLTDIYI